MLVIAASTWVGAEQVSVPSKKARPLNNVNYHRGSTTHRRQKTLLLPTLYLTSHIFGSGVSVSIAHIGFVMECIERELSLSKRGSDKPSEMAIVLAVAVSQESMKGAAQ